jgi:2-methylcitrate dehydratase PrpD
VHASAAKIADPVIHSLIDRIQVGAAPTDNVARYRQGATVTIRSHDGRTATNTVYVPKGAAMLGIAWSDVDAKYRTLVPASGLPERAIEASLAVIHDFRRTKTVSALTGLLRVGGGVA